MIFATYLTPHEHVYSQTQKSVERNDLEKTGTICFLTYGARKAPQMGPRATTNQTKQNLSPGPWMLPWSTRVPK